MTAALRHVLIGCILLLAVSFPADARAQVDHPDRDAIVERLKAREGVYYLPLATLRQRANGGDLHAIQALINKYRDGLEVPQSWAQVDQWSARALQVATERMARGDAYAGYYHAREMWGSRDDRTDQQLVRLLLTSAEAGAPEAMYELGLAYQRGDREGLSANRAEALRWFELAAASGHCGAILATARLYLEPDQGGRDVARATQWFRIASEEPYTCRGGADHPLALIYHDGDGNVPKNHVEALRYAIRATEGSDPTNFYLMVGFYYENGLGVPVDRVEAQRWFQRAGYSSVEAVRQMLAERGIREPD